MGLIDRIKESGKKLALAGVLGSSLYLSGCLTTPQEAGRLFIKPIFTGDFDEWNKQGQMSQQGNNQGVNGQNSSLQGNGNYGNQQQVSTQNNSKNPYFEIISCIWEDINNNKELEPFLGEVNKRTRVFNKGQKPFYCVINQLREDHIISYILVDSYGREI